MEYRAIMNVGRKTLVKRFSVETSEELENSMIESINRELEYDNVILSKNMFGDNKVGMISVSDSDKTYHY